MIGVLDEKKLIKWPKLQRISGRRLRAGDDLSSMVMSEQGEARRLDALYALDLLDTGKDQEYTEVVELAAEICEVPISYIALIDEHRQWFKAAIGLDVLETARDQSFCTYTITQPDMIVIDDLRQDARFREHTAVQGEAGMRFYAGVPLLSGDRQPVGTLCVMDAKPRTLTESQRKALAILARQVQTRMEGRAKQRQLERISAEKDQLSKTLEAKNRMFSAFMDHGPFVSYIKDVNGRIVFYNARLQEAFGVEGDAWLGKSDEDLWPAKVAEKFRRGDQQVIQGGVPAVLEEQSPGSMGSTITWRSYKFPIVNEEGVVMVGGMSVDVTEEKAQKAELERALQEAQELTHDLARSQALLRTLLEYSPNGCYLKDEDGRYLFYNRRFAEHFGISGEQWLGLTDFDLVPLKLAKQMRADDQRALESEGVVESLGAGKAGTRFKMLKFRCVDENGQRMLAGMAVDITGELEQQERLRRTCVELEEKASMDGLTGLMNRHTFDARIVESFVLAQREGSTLSLIILDIDDFKRRNDQFGHVAGDTALRLVGEALSECCRKGDIAARVGGEEFALLLPGTEQADAERLGERVLRCVREIRGTEMPLTVSVGVATMTEMTHSAERLYERADDAMYVAKRQGKDRLVVDSAHLELLLREVAQRMEPRTLPENRDLGKHDRCA